MSVNSLIKQNVDIGFGRKSCAFEDVVKGQSIIEHFSVVKTA